MNEAIYTFQGKDITMNVCIQIRLIKPCSKRKTLFGRKRQNILPTDILKNTRMERGNLTIGKTFAGGFY